jgi:chromosome segregation ATPase
MLSSSQAMPEQPEILLQLRQKAAELRNSQASLRDQNKQLAGGVASASEELGALLREREVQERKGKSLVLLVSDIQRQLDDFYSSGPAADDEESLAGENRMLRGLLVKLAERAKEEQKLLSFLRQASASGGKAQEYVLSHVDSYSEASTWRDRQNYSANYDHKSPPSPTPTSSAPGSGANWNGKASDSNARKASYASRQNASRPNSANTTKTTSKPSTAARPPS